FHSRHHEQLLEELWGLWQGIPGSGVETRWHEEVASTLGCGAGEGGGFDLDESRIIEHVPSCFVHMCAEPDRVSRVGPTQIEVTVLQPHFFAHVNPLVQCRGNLERQCCGGVEYLHVRGDDLDLTRGKVRVGVAFGPRRDLASDLEDILAA